MQIGGTSLYYPAGRLTPEEWHLQGHITAPEMERLRRIGIRAVAVDDQTPAPLMMERTLERLFQEHALEPRRIKYVILPYLYYSFPASLNVFAGLRDRFALTNALCFSVRDLLCSNILMGLHIAWKMLERLGEAEDMAVILTVEKSLLADQRYGGGHFLTGDGGAATFIGRGVQGDRLLAFRSATDVRTIQQGKMKNGREDMPDYFYYVNLVKVIRHTLAEAGTKIEDIRWIIPNNVAVETWTHLSDLLKIDVRRFYSQGLVESGHLNNCDVLFNLHHVRKAGKLRPGDCYMLLTLGSGGVICCAVCRKGPSVSVVASNV